MNEFEGWDFAIDFSPNEAAALIVGKQPSPKRDEEWEPIFRRMQLAYELAFEHHRNTLNPTGERLGSELDPQMLQSDAMSCRHANCSPSDSTVESHLFWDWLQHEPSSDFGNQRFTRMELIRWVGAIGMKSVYQFDRSISLEAATYSGTPYTDIDPSDLPIELDAANVAYRAVLNAYGNQSETFKKRLIAYLQENYTDLKPEAVQRIATVANPDKSAGRKKRNKE